jgi:hypothetical protein
MLDYKTLSNIRLIAIAFNLVGIFMHLYWVMGFGIFVWIVSYMYSFGIIERAFFAMLEQQRQKDKTNEDQE